MVQPKRDCVVRETGQNGLEVFTSIKDNSPLVSALSMMGGLYLIEQRSGFVSANYNLCYDLKDLEVEIKNIVNKLKEEENKNG